MNTQEIKQESIYDNLEGGEGSARINCLARHLDIKEEDIKINYFDEGYDFQVGEKQFKILTNKESDKACKEHLKESLWACSSWFLSKHTNHKIDEEVFKKLQSLCEDSNDSIYKLIDNFDELVEDAIGIDGRGHFLSSYDGHENYEEWNGEFFYIYRTN